MPEQSKIEIIVDVIAPKATEAFKGLIASASTAGLAIGGTLTAAITAAAGVALAPSVAAGFSAGIGALQRGAERLGAPQAFFERLGAGNDALAQVQALAELQAQATGRVNLPQLRALAVRELEFAQRRAYGRGVARQVVSEAEQPAFEEAGRSVWGAVNYENARGVLQNYVLDYFPGMIADAIHRAFSSPGSP